MALSETAKNAMLDALGALITHIGLANNGTEISGGSPAYARQAVSWDAASGGVMEMSGTETFDVEGGDTVDEIKLYGHSSNATPDYGGAAITDEVFGSQGTLTVNSLTVTLSDA